MFVGGRVPFWVGLTIFGLVFSGVSFLGHFLGWFKGNQPFLVGFWRGTIFGLVFGGVLGWFKQNSPFLVLFWVGFWEGYHFWAMFFVGSKETNCFWSVFSGVPFLVWFLEGYHFWVGSKKTTIFGLVFSGVPFLGHFLGLFKGNQPFLVGC